MTIIGTEEEGSKDRYVKCQRVDTAEFDGGDVVDKRYQRRQSIIER